MFFLNSTPYTIGCWHCRMVAGGTTFHVHQLSMNGTKSSNSFIQQGMSSAPSRQFNFPLCLRKMFHRRVLSVFRAAKLSLLAKHFDFNDRTTRCFFCKLEKEVANFECPKHTAGHVFKPWRTVKNFVGSFQRGKFSCHGKIQSTSPSVPTTERSDRRNTTGFDFEAAPRRLAKTL